MKFEWGEPIAKFTYDFDGRRLDVIKYHEWKRNGSRVLVGEPNMDDISFHCEELSESFECLDRLLIAWIAKKNLGLNQHALVSGIHKALTARKAVTTA